MLDAIRRRLSRALLPLSLVLVAIFALSTSGCLALVKGVQNASLTFPLEQKPNGTFWAWNEITIDQDISGVESATLVSVTLKITAPAGRNFGFLSSLKGEVVSDSGRTLVATMGDVPPEEEALVLDLHYKDDLRPLFKDDHTIRIEWTGTTNPAVTDWPVGGYTVEANVQIYVE
jgi:hypothetical protein